MINFYITTNKKKYELSKVLNELGCFYAEHDIGFNFYDVLTDDWYIVKHHIILRSYLGTTGNLEFIFSNVPVYACENSKKQIYYFTLDALDHYIRNNEYKTFSEINIRNNIYNKMAKKCYFSDVKSSNMFDLSSYKHIHPVSIFEFLKQNHRIFVIDRQAQFSDYLSNINQYINFCKNNYRK